MSRQVKEFLKHGTPADVKKNILNIIKKAQSVQKWINNNVTRDSKRVVLENLITSTISYLELCKKSLDQHISVLALSTRSTYEINTRIRSILEIEGEIEKWQSEAITDKIQTLEGIKMLDDSAKQSDEKASINNEIYRLESLLSKYDLPEVKTPESTGSLARKVNLEEEHKALFKLYSKLVHPSSYLVNDYQNAASVEIKFILQVQVQIYAIDSIVRICDEYKVPYEISKPYGKKHKPSSI